MTATPIGRADAPPRPSSRPACSGAMTDHGSAPDPQPVRLSVTLVRVLCAPCRDAAARLGMLERRDLPRDRGGFCEPDPRPLRLGA